MNAESVGYWYLRLNGFLTIANFVVHPDEGPGQRTDVDILGVRFPYRRELVLGPHPMEDHAQLVNHTNLPMVVIAEVKSRRPCSLNGPWTKPPDLNLHRVLAAVGAFPEPELNLVATALYKQGRYTDNRYHVTLLCLGDRRNPHLLTRYPDVPQITWGEALEFIWHRFRSYERQKASHDQWDLVGKELWRLAMETSDPAHYRSAITLEGA